MYYALDLCHIYMSTGPHTIYVQPPFKESGHGLYMELIHLNISCKPIVRGFYRVHAVTIIYFTLTNATLYVHCLLISHVHIKAPHYVAIHVNPLHTTIFLHDTCSITLLTWEEHYVLRQEEFFTSSL